MKVQSTYRTVQTTGATSLPGQTCRNLDINPQEYLEDVLRRIMGHPAKQIHELLPDRWLAARTQQHDDMPQTDSQDGLG